MTLPRYYDLHRYWRKFPPADWLVASYLGYKPREDVIENPDDMVAELSRLGGGVRLDKPPPG